MEISLDEISGKPSFEGPVKIRGSYKFSRAAILAGEFLALTNNADPSESTIALLQIGSSCATLGADVFCRCSPVVEGSAFLQSCKVRSSLARIGSGLRIPPNTIAEFSGGLELGEGAQLEMAMSARLSVRGSFAIRERVSLLVSDNRRRVPDGKYELLSVGSIEGRFSKVALSKTMIFSRIFFCLQIPKIKISIEGFLKKKKEKNNFIYLIFF